MKLKQYTKLKGLLVEGLKLTRDGRLIESKKSRNPKDYKSPQISKEQPKVPTEKPKPMIVKRIRYFINDNKVYCECGNRSIAKANILEGTEVIGKFAFYFCHRLNSVNIPNSVIEIEFGAFESCTSLVSVTLPSLLNTIGYGAFRRCTSLTTITIPNSVTKIGNCAFWGCTNLKYVYCYKGSKADNPGLYPAKVTLKYL